MTSLRMVDAGTASGQTVVWDGTDYVSQDKSVVDVRDHGAVLDGTMNDLTALTDAIAAVPADGGVVLITGPLAISAVPLVERSDIEFWGIGPRSRIVRISGYEGHLLHFRGTAGAKLRRVGVRHLRFGENGIYGGAGALTSAAIKFEHCIEFEAERAYVQENAGPAVWTVDSFIGKISYGVFRSTGGGTAAIMLGNVANNINIVGNRIKSNTGHGIATEGTGRSRAVLVHGNDIEGNSKSGIKFSSTGPHRAWSILGNYFELNDWDLAGTEYDLHIPSTAGTVSGVVIEGNSFEGGLARVTGVKIEKGTSGRLAGNSFKDYTTGPGFTVALPSTGNQFVVEQDQEGSSVYGLHLHGRGVNSLSSSIAITNHAGRTYSMSSGIRGVQEVGWGVYDETSGLRILFVNGELNTGIAGFNSWGGAEKVVGVPTAAVEPTANPAGGFLLWYWNGQVKMRTSTGDVINLSKLAALTAADASAVNSGDATTDAVINNLRTRLNEVEARLKSLGLLT